MDVFWLYMMIITMVIPVVMICIGSRLSRKAPENVKSIFGYRTKRAKSNQDTWEFANKHCGKIWHMLGIAVAVLTIGVMRGCYHESQEMVGVIGGAVVLIQVFVVGLSMIPTELALRKTFDENGKRR